MSQPIAGQSNDAAERSAHVTRGGPEVADTQGPPNFIRLPDGTTKVRRIHDLEQEVMALREGMMRDADKLTRLSREADRLASESARLFYITIASTVTGVGLLAWVLL